MEPSNPSQNESSPKEPEQPKENTTTEDLTNQVKDLTLEEQKASKEETQEKKPEESPENPNAEAEGDSKANEKKKEEESEEEYLNLAFYQNKIKSRPRGTYIEDMHKNWWGDYDLLEDDHSYIQWLFPNFYKSNFNAYAPKLEEYEAQKFRTDFDITRRLVKSYELILDFYGMKLVNRKTGELARTEGYLPRYKEALLTYFHNHLRIRRILTHLNNVGFRRYAVKLVDFLEAEIYGEVGGFEKYEKKDKSFNKDAYNNAPLRKLASRDVFETWAIYGNHYNDPKRIALLEKNCFCKYPEGFVDSAYF